MRGAAFRAGDPHEDRSGRPRVGARLTVAQTGGSGVRPAAAAGGASLFALGLMLYGEPVRINADVLTNIGLKNFLQPGLMLLGIAIFGLSGPLASQV